MMKSETDSMQPSPSSASRSRGGLASSWPSMRRLLVGVGALLVFGAYNLSIYLNERTLESGVVVRLRLAPVDPRALMYGDYMRLDYEIQNQLRRGGFEIVEPMPAQDVDTPSTAPPREHVVRLTDIDGYAIVAVDERRIARLVRAQATPRPVNEGEVALRYRVRGSSIVIGTNAYFFQEGTAERYDFARYGEYRVDANGKMLLVRLLDENLKPL